MQKTDISFEDHVLVGAETPETVEDKVMTAGELQQAKSTIQ